MSPNLISRDDGDDRQRESINSGSIVMFQNKYQSLYNNDNLSNSRKNLISQAESRFINNINNSGSSSPDTGNKKISQYLNEMNHNIENRNIIE